MNLIYHADLFLFLPMLAVQQGECANPECKEKHYLLNVGWLAWSIEIIF